MPRRKVASAPLEGRNRRELIRRLAADKETQTALAEEFGVTPSAVSQFCTRHKEEIEALKEDANAELNKLWITSKTERVRSYQDDAEMNEELIAAARALVARANQRAEDEEEAERQQSEDRFAGQVLSEVPKLQRVKQAALRGAAEELGQIPTGTKVEVNDNRVNVELVGVNLDKV